MWVASTELFQFPPPDSASKRSDDLEVGPADIAGDESLGSASVGLSTVGSNAAPEENSEEKFLTLLYDGLEFWALEETT